MAQRFRGNFARPENALKRADELENVGQKLSALQQLHDVVTSKKHRTWSKTYEEIMFKLLDLCVEMKKRNHAKEALMQYRNMCQQVNINSLEEVIKYYLNKATEKAEEARAQAESKTLDAVEDLEEDAKPEDLMLSYVSGDKSKDRTDRELVTPWFRFLWESYRSVLEILRTNPKLEALYAMTAVRAFGFCLTYKRNAEFRRLCDILRQHLANMNKYREQRDMTAPETLNCFLETRFEQLKTACELQMWAEAFRSVEDIQTLITLGKRQPKQQMMATYYSRLTQIFAVSRAYLYHGYAWLKLFNFSRSFNKNLTPADTSMMATSVVLATLAILPYERALFGRTDDISAEQERERTLRMAHILGFTVDKRSEAKSILTRAALVSSIGSMSLLALVPAEVRAAWELLTNEFNPLELCNKLAPLLDQLAAIESPMSAASPVRDLAMAQYLPSLKQVAVLRSLKQLGEVYSSMHIAEVAALVPFMTFAEVEAVVVDAVKYDYLQLRVDHRNGTLHFGGQNLESDKLRGHMALLAKRLAKAAAMADPAPAPAAEAQRLAVMRMAREHMGKEHSRLLARKQVIEKRKEQAEAQAMEQEREEERKRLQAAREQELLEEKRRREEAARREKERLERELEEQEMEEARQLLEQTRKKKGGTAVKDGEKLDRKTLMQDVLSERLKEAQELERKLARLAKTMDHMERARREEEAPLLDAAYAARALEDEAYHKEAQEAAAAAHRLAWEVDAQEKRRLERMGEDKGAFAALIVSRRQEEFEALKRARERRAADRRAKRKIAREIARREEFVRRCRAAVDAKIEELEEQRAAEEEEKRKAEEERKRAEREDMRRRAEEAAAKQRAREEEIERKLREEKEAILAGRGAPPPAAAASAGGGGGSGRAAFVPPALRRKMDEEAAGRGGGGAPAAGGAADWRGERGERDARPPPAEDRWARRDGPPPARDGPPPARDGPPPARDGPPRRATARPGGGRQRRERRRSPPRASLMGAAASKEGMAPSAVPRDAAGERGGEQRGSAAEAPSSSCPVPESARRSTAVYNVYAQRIDGGAGAGACPSPLSALQGSDLLDPKNNMPLEANQQPCPGQRKPLSTERVQSNIPKGGTDTTWLYPSPQMFFNALRRKGKGDDVSEEQMDAVVRAHNAMNELTWRHVMDWEQLHCDECKHATLLKFQGRPHDLSPLARLRSWVSGEVPFDRHDWVLDRCGREVRYVIDFYFYDHLAGTPQAFEVVARPALDSAEAALDRAKMAIYTRFAAWGLPCPVTGHATGRFAEPAAPPAGGAAAGQ
ncbi:TIF3A1 [Scenedesmus sp. PABB004]|nr:TIF3A1 [Scenedesmus sp. PABB004]